MLLVWGLKGMWEEVRGEVSAAHDALWKTGTVKMEKAAESSHRI